MRYTMKTVQSHIEVYDESGLFLFSADNQQEALQELQQQEAA